MAVKTYTAKHERARFGCFTAQGTGNGKQVSSYYGRIACCKTEAQWSEEALGKRLMSATKHDCQSWAIHLGQKPKCSDEQTFNAWLVPSKFIRVRLIKNARSISSESEDTSDVTLVTNSSNVVVEEL